MKKSIGLEAERLGLFSLMILAFTLLLLTSYRSCTPGSGGNYRESSPPKPPPGSKVGGVVAMLTVKQAPRHVRRIIRYLKSARHLNPPTGYKGGRIFRNREGILPRGKTYYEYDVHPLRPGVSRGSERLVVDQHKRRFYYTRDHYRTSVQIE